MGGVTNSHVMVNSTWYKNSTAFSPVNGHIKLLRQAPSANGTVHSWQLMFSPLSSSKDNGCMVTLTSQLQGVVFSTRSSESLMTLAVKGDILIPRAKVLIPYIVPSGQNRENK